MTDVCTVKKSNLVLPSTYYELDREEMSYVEGGFVLRTWMVSAPIDMALMLCGATMIFAGVKILGKFFGNAIGKALSNMVSPIVVKLVSMATSGLVNLTVGQIGKAIYGNLWSFTSLGGVIGFVLDIAIDGKLNGIIHEW